MNNMTDGYGYNERLFESQSLRSYFHFARFHWLRDRVAKYHGAGRVARALELGCFDGKSLDALPTGRPLEYLGFDANWENGLDLARAKFATTPGYEFREIQSAAGFDLSDQKPFQIAMAMETFEHVKPDDIDVYLERIASKLNGHFFVTVPNEKGVFFLLKWLAKRILGISGEKYQAMEVLNATLGRMHLVKRVEHKGFDWEALVKQMKKHFDIVEVSGHPLSVLPTSLCFGVAIVARTKRLTQVRNAG
jgi:2-polyprenyl-3-methyl-5-hydroxy-6-metoxy-1,4-benzoquinol methylase